MRSDPAMTTWSALTVARSSRRVAGASSVNGDGAIDIRSGTRAATPARRPGSVALK